MAIRSRVGSSASGGISGALSCPVMAMPRPPRIISVLALLAMLMLASLPPHSKQLPPMADAATLVEDMQNSASSVISRGLSLQKALVTDLATRGFLGGATLLSWLLSRADTSKNGTATHMVGAWLQQMMLGGGSGPVGITLLVPTDATLGSAASIPPKDYMGVLKLHVLPGVMTFDQLQRLPAGTWLPTALSGSGLVVSDDGGKAANGTAASSSPGAGSSRGLSLGGVPVARPNLCPTALASFGVACQGIGGLLDLKQAQPQPQNSFDSNLAGGLFVSPASPPSVSSDSPAEGPSGDGPAARSPSPAMSSDAFSPTPSPTLSPISSPTEAPVPSPDLSPIGSPIESPVQSPDMSPAAVLDVPVPATSPPAQAPFISGSDVPPPAYTPAGATPTGPTPDQGNMGAPGSGGGISPPAPPMAASSPPLSGGSTAPPNQGSTGSQQQQEQQVPDASGSSLLNVKDGMIMAAAAIASFVAMLLL